MSSASRIGQSQYSTTLLLDVGRSFRVANSQPLRLAVHRIAGNSAVLSFRRHTTHHLLGNLETGKSKKEFCASLRFRAKTSVIGTKSDRIGQNRTVWDSRGQIRTTGTLSTHDSMPQSLKRPQKAARARAKARYAKILRLAGEEVATRNQATLEQVLEHSKQQ
jgi:hypothetical protein